MGRGIGVEIRPGSIRFTFLEGKPTLMLNGEPAKPTAANVKWAQRLALEIREKIKHGTFVRVEYFPASGNVGAPLTVGVQLDTWLSAQRIAVSTRKTYTSSVLFWKRSPYNDDLNAMAGLPLRALRHSHVMRALAASPALSGKTINNHVSVLREACALAVLDRTLTSNPVESIKEAPYQRPLPDPFTQAEAEAIIADLRAHYSPLAANYGEFRLFTGLRPSEAIALRWASVDLRRGEMLISEAKVLGDVKGTKTSTARTVKLNSRAAAVLERQRTLTYLEAGVVFHDPARGQAWADEKPFKMRCWMPCLKRLGMRYRAPYNMRHTYATMMLMAGMNPAFCARQMGHDVQVFLTTYARWLDGDRDDMEMQRLERTLSPDLRKTSS